MKSFQEQRIKSVLKSLLKKKKFNYEQVAEKLDCSVPTVKRILGPEELSLTRLLQLCDLLSLDLGELQSLMGDESEEEAKFTPAQEAFLAKNRSHFAYLMKLFESKSPKQIGETYGLTARSNDKYLIALEKNELIKVSSGGKVRPAFKSVPRLGNGPLAKAYFESLIQAGGKFFIRFIHEELTKLDNSPTNPGGAFSVWTARVSQESYKNWKAEQAKALQELAKKASYEEKTRYPSELMTAVIVQGHALVSEDYHGLQNLEQIFGKIENL